MNYQINEEMIKDRVEQVLGFKTYSDKRKIDSLLEITADIWANEGKDSSKADIENARKNARIVYRAIKKIDYATGELFLRVQDRKDD